MPMKVEAAIVTQKRPEAAYNTDSVNVNGKVMPREVIKNGYKGSGVLGSSVYFALTSSAVEGFADATVTAFNQRAELFSRSRDSLSVFSGFFEDCRGALINMKRSADELVSAGFYATGRKSVLAFNGNAKIYLQRLGVLTPVNGEKVIDTTADFRGAVFNDTCVSDTFILLSPGAAEVLTDKDIEDILKISDGSVKKVANYILKAALSKNSDKAVSAIVIKVLETALDEEIITSAFVPDFAEEEKATVEEEAEAAEVTSMPEEEVAASDDIAAVFSKNVHEMFDDGNADEETETFEEAAEEEITASEEAALYVEAMNAPDEEPDASEEEIGEDVEKLSEEAEAVIAAAEDAEKSAADKKKTLLLFLGGVLIAFALAALVAFVIVPAFSGEEEGTTEEETSVEETSDEQTTEEGSAEAETTEEETTEKAEEKTTKKEESTTKRRPAAVSTTAASATAPAVTTTKPQETTTEEEATSEQEATTAEETTEAEEATTAEEEGTTEAQETTEAEATTEAENEAEETSTEAVAEEEEPSSDEVTSAEEAASDNGAEEETQAH